MTRDRKMPAALPVSFPAYIARRRTASSSAARFVAVARQDPTLPAAATWPELKAYLIGRGHDRSLVDAAYLVWMRYRRVLREHAER